MSAEAKCTCQHCGGHIAFSSEAAGQTVDCPHCKLETLLSTPPVATLPKPKSNNTNIIRLSAVVIFLFACGAVAFFLQKSPKSTEPANAANLPHQSNETTVVPTQRAPEQPHLTPVVSAFGWKLGDKLPDQLRSQVKDATYNFTPDTETPPFVESNNCSFYLSLTKDGQIAQISAVALNVAEDDFYDTERRLISLLTDKYGLLHHDPNETGDDAYYFGTEDRKAHLAIQTVATSEGKEYIFKLDFYDRQLYEIVCDEYNDRIKKEDADKTAPLSKQFK